MSTYSSCDSAAYYSFSKSGASKNRQWPKLPPSQLRHRDRPTNTIGPSTLSTRRIRLFKKFSNREKTTTSKTRSGVAEIDPLRVRWPRRTRRCEHELLRGKIGSVSKLLMN